MSDANENSVIFYFSGTGNSLAVARGVSAGLGKIKIQSMAVPIPGVPLGGKGAVVGFVFPSYFGALPRIVKQFAEGISLLPETYCFAVVTGGGPLAGSSIVALKEVLAGHGAHLAYGESIVMIGNYIIKYNPPCNENAVQKMTARTEAAIAGIVADVAARKTGGMRRIHFAANTLYRDIEHLDDRFFADEQCDHCGLCERICPVQNIQMADGKPQWQHHCEHCVACIHWCPRGAIQFGDRTAARRRYHHPSISAADLIPKEEVAQKEAFPSGNEGKTGVDHKQGSLLYSEMDLPDAILRAVAQMGFTELTEIQEKAMPPMMEGQDIIAKAPTGTGKTCAFGIPLLLGLDEQSDNAQCLILAPTRELARQITEDLQDLAHFMPAVRIACVYGGQAIRKQFAQLKKNPQIIVATPGRLLDHMQRRTINLKSVTRVVLDEADEMLNMGFYKDVRRILDSLKGKKQLGMFSATISREVMDIGWLYQRDPVEITVQPLENSMPKIDQYSILTTGPNKLRDLADIVEKNGYRRVIVFCNAKYTTSMLSNQLTGLHIDADCLHGDLLQGERNKVMGRFREGNLRVLVSTDVAARGIDVEDVDAVINYDVPTSNEYYTHRIGRTGRAGKEGAAYILFTADEEARLRDMVRLTRNTVIPVRFDETRRLVEDAQ